MTHLPRLATPACGSSARPARLTGVPYQRVLDALLDDIGYLAPTDLDSRRPNRVTSTEPDEPADDQPRQWAAHSEQTAPRQSANRRQRRREWDELGEGVAGHGIGRAAVSVGPSDDKSTHDDQGEAVHSDHGEHSGSREGDRQGLRDDPAEPRVGPEPAGAEGASSPAVDERRGGQSPQVVEPVLPELDDRTLGRTTYTEEEHSLHIGPLPDPDTMRAYDDIVPGAAERIIAAMERSTYGREAAARGRRQR